MDIEKINGALEGCDNFLISTGNILSINDITKKVNLNTSDEVCIHVLNFQ